MLIQICDADKSGKRRIIVTDGDKKVFSSVADDLVHAHRVVRDGHRHGWDTVTPEALAAKTKAAEKVETQRVEKGKAEAEPKGK